MLRQNSSILNVEIHRRTHSFRLLLQATNALTVIRFHQHRTSTVRYENLFNLDI